MGWPCEQKGVREVTTVSPDHCARPGRPCHSFQAAQEGMGHSGCPRPQSRDAISRGESWGGSAISAHVKVLLADTAQWGPGDPSCSCLSVCRPPCQARHILGGCRDPLSRGTPGCRAGGKAGAFVPQKSTAKSDCFPPARCGCEGDSQLRPMFPALCRLITSPAQPGTLTLGSQLCFRTWDLCPDGTEGPVRVATGVSHAYLVCL